MKNKLAFAIAIAAEQFKNTFDKSGQPYMLHCIRVMNSVNQNDSELMQIAILHDVPEDTEIKLEHLRSYGFSDRVLEAVKLLTHDDPNLSYDDYIKRIGTNKDATAVKIADLIDNSNITRLKGLRKKDLERMEKYHRSFIYLSN